ncbi:MAG: hypothetical protein KAU31_02915, partial [Spirochaetaceae bacterium]|nr:hypothetical protein [Spirochaetaceae bacterium]
LGVANYGPGQDRYRAISTISLDRSGESTRSRGTVSRSSSMRWIFVAGTPPDTVRIRAIPQRTEYEIDKPTPGSQYLISTVSTLDSDHAIDATPIIVRNGTRTSRDEVIRSEALAVTDTPLVREINLFQPLFFIVNLDRSGQWAIVHDRPDDSPVAIGMIPFRDLHDIVTPHVVTDNPASFDVEAGQHMVLFQPYTPGVFQFALYYRGDASAANDRRAADLLKSSAPKPREDITYVTSPNEIMAGRDHMVLANNRGGPMTALFAQRLPLNLEEEVPLTLSPGETLSIPVSPTTPGVISTGYSSIELRLGGRLLNSGQVIPVGRSTITVTNTGSSTTTFVLRLDPTFVPSFTAPAIPAIEEALPILTPGPAVYHDYERDHARQFLLVVDEPAFYELQTTGRLTTRISTRTPANPNGFNAEGNGPGRNALVQAYFRPGIYLVDVKPQGSSEGRAGLVMSPLPMEDLGRLSEGAWYRTELDPGVGLKGTVGVQTAGRFALQTIGLYGSPTTRLEDADAWPLEGTLLGPGVYTYLSWPQTVWNRRLTGYFRQADDTVFAEDEPWQLNLNESHRRTWNETPDRNPHLFQVDSPATIPVTLRTSSRMEWWVTDEEDLPVFEGRGAETFDLPAGRNTIRVRSREENNNVGYEISLSTTVLADGLEQRIQRVPTGIPVVVGQSGVYEFWSTGTRDVRATLRTKDGELLLAEGDDRPGDWNFHISRYLPPDEYLLNVTESFPGSGAVTVACQLRDEVWVDPQGLPLDTRIQLDRAIVGIPFRTDRSDAPIRITADSSAAHLALYRDETLIAEGRDALFVPLLGDREYLLRIRNDSLTTTAVGLQVAAADARRLEWAGVEPLQLPPGAATITNRTAISVIAPAQRHPPLLSGAFEQPARELGGGVLANPGGTIWSWYDGNQPVQVQPFVMKPGPARAFDITDDDVSMWVISPSGTVSVLEARTMAGHLGVKAVGSSSDG